MRLFIFNQMLGFVWRFARFRLSFSRFRRWPKVRPGKTGEDTVDSRRRGIGSSQSRPHYAWGWRNTGSGLRGGVGGRAGSGMYLVGVSGNFVFSEIVVNGAGLVRIDLGTGFHLGL